MEASSGDVLAVVNAHGGYFGGLVRIVERLQGKSRVADHVVILTHQDALGRWMAIEGRPRGVGLLDASAYLTDPRTRTNHDQPRPNDHGQLATFLASTAASLGVDYDWVGIVEDALSGLPVHDLSSMIDPLYAWPHDQDVMPGHVVCSSLAAWLYERVGWANPGGPRARACEPADWWTWNDQRGWVAK